MTNRDRATIIMNYAYSGSKKNKSEFEYRVRRIYQNTDISTMLALSQLYTSIIESRRSYQPQQWAVDILRKYRIIL